MTEQQQDMGRAQEAARLEVGRVLREAREQMGMSVEEVAGRLKFAPRQIAALEEGNFDQLPEMAFVRGFVRSYARLVQLDETPLLASLGSAPAQGAFADKQSAGDFLPTGSSAQKQNAVWIAGAVGVLAVIVILLWGRDGGQTASKPAADRVAMEMKPGAETKPAVGTTPGVEANPGALASSGVEARPAAEAKPAMEVKPAAEAKQVAEGKAAAGGKPGEKAKPGEKIQLGEKNRPGEKLKAAEKAKTRAEPSRMSGAAAASDVAHAEPGAVPGLVAQSPREAVAQNPGEAAAQNPAAKPAAKQQVRLEFAEDSWVEVKDGEGKILLSTLGLQGSEHRAAGAPPLSVTIGKASGVKLYYKGAPVDLGPYTRQDVAHVTLE